MFQGYSNETFEFFMAIRFNNNRPFFQDNRDWYLRAVREPTIALTQELSDTALDIDGEFDTRGHKCVSRINRDIRFSRDKSPYRDHLWLSFHHTDAEKGKLPGLYFELNDNGGYLGMGFYHGNKPLMDAIRTRILARPGEMLELYLPIAQDHLFHADISSRIVIPNEVPPELRALYAAKSFYFEREITDFDLIRSPELADEIKESFKRLQPLYRTILDLYNPED